MDSVDETHRTKEIQIKGFYLIPVPEGSYKKDGERLYKGWRDRTRGNGFRPTQEGL